MKVTFKDIIKDFEMFSSSHLQVNDFGWGNPNNISTKNHNFILVWLTPLSTIIDGKKVIIKFDLYVMDVLREDLSNLKDVMNNTLLIGNDFITYFFTDDNEDRGWTIVEDNVISEPFEAMFDDFCAGWVFKIDVEFENELNTCTIPL